VAYSRTYDLQLFDKITAVLYLKVYAFWDSTLIDVIDSFPVQLPVDSLGQVPTGTALTAHIDRVLAAVYNPAKLELRRNLIDVGGSVSNADEIFALTIDNEPTDAPLYGFPVVLWPIGGSTDFTASVISAIYPNPDLYAPLNRYNPGTLPDPTLPGNQGYPGLENTGPNTYLDNGNVWGGQLIDILGNTNTGQSNSVLIDSSPASVPQEVIDAYPYVFDHPNMTEENFVDYGAFYYITHAPMTITGDYGLGYFIYS
jgi:hypothetical protein